MTPYHFRETPQVQALMGFWSAIQRRGKLIAIVVVSFVVLTMLLSYWVTPMYRARATLLVEPPESRSHLLNNWAQLSQSVKLETELQLLRSRTLALDVVERLGLDMTDTKPSRDKVLELFSHHTSAPEAAYARYEISDGRFRNLDTGETRKLRRVGQVIEMDDRTWTLARLPKDTQFRWSMPSPVSKAAWLGDVTEIKLMSDGSNVIEILGELEDPKMVKSLVNALADAYIQANVDRRTKELIKTEDFLSDQLMEIQSEMGKRAADIQDFQESVGGLEPTTEATQILATVDALKRKEMTLKVERIQAENAKAQIANTSSIDVLMAALLREGSDSMESMVGNLREAEGELIQLRQNLTAQHPQRRDAQRRLDGLVQQARAMIDSRLDVLLEQEKALNLELAQNKKLLEGLPKKRLRQMELERSSAAEEELHAFLASGYHEAKIARAASVPTVSLIDSAILPRYPYFPNHTKNFMAAVLLGLILAIAWVMGLEYFRSTLDSLEEIESMVSLPILATIPRIDEDRRLSLARRIKDLSSRESIVRLAPNISKMDATSPVVEAFRSLRTNLHLLSDGEKDAKVFLMTSSISNEGKSTIVSNFAYVMSDLGKNVLVIDADLRNPSLHSMYDQKAQVGLAELLLGRGDEDWKNHCIHLRTGSSHRGVLDFLPSGEAHSDPSKLFHAKDIGAWVEVFRANYDFVLFDTPPVTLIPDAPLISKWVDGVMMVVAPGFTKRSAFEVALRRLEEARARVSGLIVNWQYTNEEMENYGYGYGYGKDAPQETPWPEKARAWIHKMPDAIKRARRG